MSEKDIAVEGMIRQMQRRGWEVLGDIYNTRHRPEQYRVRVRHPETGQNLVFYGFTRRKAYYEANSFTKHGGRT